MVQETVGWTSPDNSVYDISFRAVASCSDFLSLRRMNYVSSLINIVTSIRGLQNALLSLINLVLELDRSYCCRVTDSYITVFLDCVWLPQCSVSPIHMRHREDPNCVTHHVCVRYICTRQWESDNVKQNGFEFKSMSYHIMHRHLNSYINFQSRNSFCTSNDVGHVVARTCRILLGGRNVLFALQIFRKYPCLSYIDFQHRLLCISCTDTTLEKIVIYPIIMPE